MAAIIASSIGFLLSGSLNLFRRTNNSFTGVVYKVKDNYFLISNHFERYYCYQKDHSYEIGDLLTIKGEKEKLDFPVYESSFDFNNYLKTKGIKYEINVQSIKVRLKNPLRTNYIRKKILSHFDVSTAISVDSILFSNHEDNDLTNSLTELHLSRLVSASGLYFHALISIFSFLIAFKIRGVKNQIVTLIVLSPFILFNVSRFSVIRITFIYILKILNKHKWDNKYSSLELISFSGILFLFLNPYLAIQDSFVIGYLISIFMCFYGNSFKRTKGIKSKLKLAFMIYLIFIPFELNYYHSISPLSIVLQMVLSPLFILFVFISYLSIFGIPIHGLANFFNVRLSNLMNHIDGLRIEIYGPSLSFFPLVVYYGLLFFLIYYSSIGLRPFKKSLSWAISIFFLFHFVPIENTLSQEVSFINVGQGDATFIRIHNDVIFIDTGGIKSYDLAENSLIPFLKKKRIYDIDMVILTHNDYDHSGALTSLKQHFKVKKVMDNNSFTSFSFKGVNFTNYNNHIDYFEDENDKSLVIGFSLFSYHFLIMGDASISNEAMIMNEYQSVPCDILKVGHHGSNTSSSETFIKWLSPKVGIISCGKNNKYHHPHQEVIDILKRNNVKIRRTDIEGTITYKKMF